MALKSVTFNGSSTYVSCGNVPTSGKSCLTVEAWVYFNSLASSTQGIVSKDGGNGQDWALYTSNYTKISFRTKNNLGHVRTATFTGVTTGRWYHVAGVYDGDDVFVYVNGVVGGTIAPQISVIATSAQSVEIGRYSGSGYLSGKIGYVSISDNVRYAANFVVPTLPRAVDSHTLAQWNFTDSSTSLFNVKYVSTYNGTITSGTWGLDTPFFRNSLDTCHLFELKISGTDFFSNVVAKTFRYNEAEGGQTSTLSFDIEETGAAITINSWSEVVWLVDGIKEFGGYITKNTPRVAKNTNRKVYSITCESYVTVFGKVPKIKRHWIAKTSREIIIDLLAQVGLSEFDTSTYVSSGQVWNEFSCDKEPLTDTIDRLAKKDGFIWKIDANKYFYYQTASSSPALFSVGEITNSNATTVFPVSGEPSSTYDESDIRNRIKIVGGATVSEIIIERFDGNNNTLMFQLQYAPVYDVLYVLVGTSLQHHCTDWYSVFADGCDCLVNYLTGTVRWDTGNAPPSGTENVVVAYRRTIEISHQCESSASHTHYGRWFDYEVSDPTIKTEYMAQQVCASMIDQYEFGRFEGTFDIERFGLHVGQEVSIALPTIAVDALYTIRTVAIEIMSGLMVTCSVRFGDRRPRITSVLQPPQVVGSGGITGPITMGGGSGGGGGLVLAGGGGGIGPRLGGEAEIIRLNDRIEAFDKKTVMTDASDFGDATGVVMLYDKTTNTGKLVGLNDGVVQAYFDSNGSIRGGEGKVIIDESGLRIVSTTGSLSPKESIRFASEDGTKTYAQWYTFKSLASIDSYIISDGNEHDVNAHGTLTLSAFGNTGKYGNITLFAQGDGYSGGQANFSVLGDTSSSEISLLADIVYTYNGFSVNTNASPSGDFTASSVDVDKMLWLDSGTSTIYLGGDDDAVVVEKQGNFYLANGAKRYEDLRIEFTNIIGGAQDPTIEQFINDGMSTIGVYLYGFTREKDESAKHMSFVCQMPHNWDSGDITFHIHWTAKDSELGVCVQWAIEYTWQGIGGVFTTTSQIDSYTTIDSDPDVTAYKHYVTEFSPITPVFHQVDKSSIIVGRIIRRGFDASNDTYSYTAYLLQVDLSYKVNTFGTPGKYS